jgi:uncharacterized membrane protein
MDKIKGILVGFMVYFLSDCLSVVSGISKLLFLIWLSTIFIAYTMAKDEKNKSEKMLRFKLLAIVALIGTAVALFTEYIGVSIGTWI